MSDIFISYASQDRPRAQVLAQALEQHGWSVWWDRTIPTGKRFEQVIQEALAGARCVMVLWSKQSVTSDWVVEEAEEGRKRHVLVPVFIEDVLPPMGFRRIQAADLIDWDGAGTSPLFQRLVGDIVAILGPPAKTKVGAAAIGETKERKTPIVEQEMEPPPVAVPPEARPSAKTPRSEPPPAPFRPSPVRKVLPWFIGIAFFVAAFAAFQLFRKSDRVVTEYSITLVNRTGSTLTPYRWVNGKLVPGGTNTVPTGHKQSIDAKGRNVAYYAEDRPFPSPNGLYVQIGLSEKPARVLVGTWSHRVPPGQAGKDLKLQPKSIGDYEHVVKRGGQSTRIQIIIVVDPNFRVELSEVVM
jgi:hypothetical protein